MGSFIHTSHAPRTVGEFNVTEAKRIARLSSSPEAKLSWYMYAKARLFSDNPGVVPTNIYRQTQRMINIGASYIPGVELWHTDPIEVILGYSSRPTQILKGTMQIPDKYRAQYEELNNGAVGAGYSFILTTTGNALVELALQAGDLEPVDPIEPGKLVLLPTSTIHRALPAAVTPATEDRLVMQAEAQKYFAANPQLAA